jgi:hypothetical protein
MRLLIIVLLTGCTSAVPAGMQGDATSSPDLAPAQGDAGPIGDAAGQLDGGGSTDASPAAPDLLDVCGQQYKDCCTSGAACSDPSLTCVHGAARSICDACGHQGQPCCVDISDAGSSPGQGSLCFDGSTCGTHSHYCGCGDYSMVCCPAESVSADGCAPGQGACMAAGCGVS